MVTEGMEPLRQGRMSASHLVAPAVTTILAAIGAVVATWPLARVIGSGTLRSGEVLLTASQLNAYHQALLTNPLAWADANIFFPYDHAATFNDLLLTHALITLPAAGFDSPVLALNLAFLGGFALCGLFAHLLIVELVGDGWAGTVGGTLFALAPFRFLHSGHLSIAAAWAIPLFFWALLRHMRHPAPWRAGLAAVAGVLVVLSSLYHAAYVAPLVPLVLLVGARRGPGGSRTWVPLTISGVLALALVASMLVPFASAMRDHGVGSASDDLLRYGADLSSLGQKPGYLNASARDSGIDAEAHLYPGTALAWLSLVGMVAALGRIMTRGGRARVAALAALVPVAGVALGFAVPYPAALMPAWTTGVIALVWIGPLALMVWAIAGTRPAGAVGSSVALRLGFAGAALAFVFALGPQARYLGRAMGPAPYWLLTQLSDGFAGTRVPARFGGVVILFLAVIAGAVIGLLRRSPHRGRRIAGAGAALAALAVCAFELPVPPLPRGHDIVALPKLDDPVYHWLAGRPGRFGVLELPDWPPESTVHYRHREWRSLRYMLAAKQHGQHLVNGTGRIEPFLWIRFRWLEPWSDEFFTYITAYLPVDYVLVHEAGIPREARDALWSRLDSGRAGWQPMFRSAAIRVYRIDRSAGRGPTIDRLFLRRLLAPLASVSFTARLASEDGRADGQSPATLELLCDGEVITTVAIGPEWQPFHARVPVAAAAAAAVTGWPRSATLLRWRVRGRNVTVELKDLSVDRNRESLD